MSSHAPLFPNSVLAESDVLQVSPPLISRSSPTIIPPLSLLQFQNHVRLHPPLRSPIHQHQHQHHPHRRRRPSPVTRSLTPQGEKPAKAGTTRTFFNTPASKVTALTSLGEGFATKKADAKREVVRKSVGSAVKELKGYEGLREVAVDASADPHAAAVAAHLALYKFTLKTSPPSRFDPNLAEPVPEKLTFTPLQASKEWERGVVYAQSQNLARTLMELPANMMTPTAFCERVKKEFEGIPNVEIIVRDEVWAAEKNMNVFLSVTHGTSEPAKFLEMYPLQNAANKDAQPLAFVGKGITFDSGGISLKPGAVRILFCSALLYAPPPLYAAPPLHLFIPG
ncbi:hypothetical protein NLJ89_g6018 [Agrocybe chaxingu]|uniref:Leucyl aminopeptidase n=1 Tax=Agrocybe chaxingu TaxID=84603 RepID=A0A9W8K000_9AGAR|nr:hypothetical protein NLJ89_g6018 [Agrocybe chaxingu]